VYEEQSLGIFPEETQVGEEGFENSGPRVSVWSRYLAMHARQQLAFGAPFFPPYNSSSVTDSRYVVAWLGFVFALHHRGWSYLPGGLIFTLTPLTEKKPR